MNRIAYMVIRNLFHVPVWFYRLCRMGRITDTHTEQEKYNFIRKIVKKVNHTGRVTVLGSGEENIPTDQGFILFPNHQGLFDMLAIIEKCPHPIRFVIKKELSNVILVKQLIRVMNGMAMDRSDVRASMKIINRMTEDVMNGKNYIIFPEGTRSKKENQILDFKAGTFKSAVNAKCPIVPVALINCYKPFDIPSIKKETVQVHFLEPIPYEQYVGLKTREIADIVHDRIQKKIDENIFKNMLDKPELV